MKRLLQFIVTMFVVLSLQNICRAQGFTATLTGAQEVPSVTTSATGTGSFTLTPAGIVFNITVEGLSGPIAAAHFHKGAVGVAGPFVRTITGDFVGNTASGVWTSTDVESLTDALIADLLVGNLYINVHTALNPGGEIRGQVNPSSGAAFTVNLPHFDTTTGQWATGVAVANVGTVSTAVTVEAFDSAGTSLGTTTLTIPANGRVAFDVGATFGTDQSGWLKLTADQPLTALEVFTNLQSGAIAGLTGVSAGSPTIFIPHFDTTTGQWASGVAVANVGSAETMATVEAFDSSGTSLGTTTLTIPANGRVAFDVAATFGTGSGWLKVTADQPLAALEVFTNLQSAAIAGLTGVQ